MCKQCSQQISLIILFLRVYEVIENDEEEIPISDELVQEHILNMLTFLLQAFQSPCP
jgi:hypothetical protein